MLRNFYGNSYSPIVPSRVYKEMGKIAILLILREAGKKEEGKKQGPKTMVKVKCLFCILGTIVSTQSMQRT